jgi:hypothetical protein
VTLSDALVNIDAAKDITFTKTITNAAADVQNLTLESDTKIYFVGAVGTGLVNLGDINITKSADVTADSTIDAKSLVQANGTGTTTLRGDVTTTGAVDLKTATVNLDGLKIDSEDIVKFNADVTLSNGLADIDAVKDITFLKTIQGAEDLTLKTNNNIDFDAAVGTTLVKLGNINITKVVNFTADASIDAASLKQDAGTGTTKFDGLVDVTGLIDVSAKAIDINADLASGSTTTLTGPVSLGAGISTKANNILITGNVTRDEVDDVTMATGAGAGNITVNGNINASAGSTSRNLTLLAGAGNIEFKGTIGDTQQLRDLVITSAHDVTFTKTIDLSRNLTQNGGTGTTAFNATPTVNGSLTMTNAIVDIAATMNITGPSALTANVNLNTGSIWALKNTLGVTGNLTQNAGTFNGNNSDTTVTGSLNLANGKFTAPSTNLSVGVNFNQTNSAFIHNNGKVIFIGNAGNVNQGLTTNGDHFFNLTVNTASTAARRNVELLSLTLDIDNDVTIERGCFSFAANSTVNVTRDVVIKNGPAGIDATKGGVTINADGSWSNSGNLAIADNGPSDGFNQGNSLVKFTSNATGKTIKSGLGSFYDVSFTGIGDWTLQDSMRAKNNLDLSSGKVTATGVNVDVDYDFNFTNGTFIAPVVMSIGDDFTQTGGDFVHNNGKVVFDGNANSLSQSVSTDGDHFYDMALNTTNNPHKRNLEVLNPVLDIDHDLSIDKGCLLLPANSIMNVTNDIAIGNGQAGIDASNNGITINIGGSWSNSGNQAIPGDGPERGFKAGDSTVVFNSNNTGETIANTHKPEFYNITFNGAGDWRLVNNLYVSNDLSIDKGTFNANAQQIELKGDWTNKDKFTASGSTVTLNGSGLQHVTTGANNSGFSTLNIRNNSPDCVSFTDSMQAENFNATGGVQKIIFASGATYSISGNLTLNGAGNLLYLVSSGGGQWLLSPGTLNDLSNLYVSNSRNLSGAFLIPIESNKQHTYKWGNKDGGNNTDWFEQFLDESTIEKAAKSSELPEAPKPQFNPEAAQSVSLGDNMVAVPEEGAQKFKKDYIMGKYRTIVIVFEGRVLVSPYDEEGAKEDKTVALTAGQTTANEGDVK